MHCAMPSPGGITGAGAKITGAVGDVFAKLSFDDQFIDKRQQEKVKSTGLGSKFGGFFKVCTLIQLVDYQQSTTLECCRRSDWCSGAANQG